MRNIISLLRQSLVSYYDTDELQTITKAICCELLRIDEYAFYLREPVTLTDEQTIILTDAIRRLRQGEPLQYILGTAPFAGLTLHVDGRVLIPRPETAGLIEAALAVCRRPLTKRVTSGAETPTEKGNTKILDLGTGSGCIAIALAKEMTDAVIFACDISDDALKVAYTNAEANGADVHFFQADMLSAANAAPSSLSPLSADGQGASLLISNPPYIRHTEKSMMEDHVTLWEPSTALFVPDDDPLLFYRAIAQIGLTDILRADGHIAVEINSAFGFETATLFEHYGYVDVHILPDIFGKDRYVTCHKLR